MTDSRIPTPPASAAPSAPTTGDSLQGFLYALAAYVLWGFLPLYMKQLAHIPPIEVIAHRVIWSVPVALLVIAFAALLVLRVFADRTARKEREAR